MLRAILFDLFGTVVHFQPQVPTIEVAGQRWRSTMAWLRPAAEPVLEGRPFDDLLAALMHVTEELTRQRPPEYREVPSRERFQRALVRIGIDPHRAPELAEELSRAHMAHLASMTMVPPTHPPMLRALTSRYRLGLVSNFDHAPTARRILVEHGLAGWFDPIIISDEFGRRKPHPAIFTAGLTQLEVRPDEALYVGDSVSDDVVGAHNAQLRVVWINPKRELLPPGAPQPYAILTALSDLPALLG